MKLKSTVNNFAFYVSQGIIWESTSFFKSECNNQALLLKKRFKIKFNDNLQLNKF